MEDFRKRRLKIGFRFFGITTGTDELYRVSKFSNDVTGSKIWSIATDGDVQSTPVVSSDGKVVYVGGTDYSLYAVNASTGSKIWNFATGGEVWSSPALSSDGKVVYVGSYEYGNSLYAVNALTGSKIWGFATYIIIVWSIG